MGRSSYPGEFDTDVELPRIDDNITEIGADAINSLRDAIFSIEEAIGTNPQGNMDDFVSRINRVIDANGNIKTSALESMSIVTLPIVDRHIGDTAGIKESKLDLDYGTSYLNSKVENAADDIETVRTSLSSFVSQAVSHYTGQGNRHDGYAIDLDEPIRGYSNVGAALHTVNNDFSDHEANISGGAHHAFGIAVNNEFDNFSATNVQEALIELDNIGSGVIEQHQDKMHDTAVAINKRGEIGEQINLSETVLAGTIFQTETSKATNIFQVMRPNVARITSKDINLSTLGVGSAQHLRIQAGGINRTYLDINLAAIIPTNSIDKVVEAINTKAHGCSYHYPISAYNTGGKLTIAHNIPGEQFTLKILSSVQFSAATALGFEDIIDQEVFWSGTSHAGNIGGYEVRDAKSLIKRHHVHSVRPLSTIVLGLGDLAQYGLTTSYEGRILCNITNHSTTPTDNGTHYILGYPNSEKFTLSADIQPGEFDIEISADAINFVNSARGELFDIFVEHDSDGYGFVTKSKRISYNPINGIDIKAVTSNLPTEDLEWQMADSSLLQFHTNQASSQQISIPAGYQGQIDAFAPDNINGILLEVTGILANGRKEVIVYDFYGTDDRLHVASVHYSGNHGLAKLKYVIDKRRVGTSAENRYMDVLNKPLVEEALKDLRNNGVVRGFDVVSFEDQFIKLRGGRALVSGRFIDIGTREVYINDFSASKKLLLLDADGNFIIKGEFDAGYSFAELTTGDSYGDNKNVATILEFETDGEAFTTISGTDGYYVDRRLLIGNIDKRLLDKTDELNKQILQIKNAVAGSMWGFTIASSDGEVFDGYGYVASIQVGDNFGFEYIDQRGFAAGNNLVTTRRFEFGSDNLAKSSIFRSVGLTHINVFFEVVYTGTTLGVLGPFGVSGLVNIDVGVSAENSAGVKTEDYATIKSMSATTLPSNSVTERYVVSIPTANLGLGENIMFSCVPRIRIVGSIYVDGGPGPDPRPIMYFDHIRVVTSSYSIAGSALIEDGSSSSLAAPLGNVL